MRVADSIVDGFLMLKIPDQDCYSFYNFLQNVNGRNRRTGPDLRPHVELQSGQPHSLK
jgi:hypothetical protein